jgi:hypothetical protein
MIDLALLQSISYIAGALGVCIAAIFYGLNLRISQRNMKQTLETRRIGLIDSITTRIANAEGRKNYQELMNYEWTDYDNFERRYGTEYNLDSSSKRYGRDYLVDLEYLAREMLRVKLQRDPQYKIPESFIKYVPDK